jgi:DNA-binding CsgD family transcriptional regulator
MAEDTRRYDLFFRFIETFLPAGFKNIDRNDPLVLEVEEMTENNNQFFFVVDMLRLKVEFTSQRCRKLIGIEPEEFSPYHLKEATHPDDLARQGLAQAQLIKITHTLAVQKKGDMLVSSSFRLRDATGSYSNRLIQAYFFYSAVPVEAVYLFDVQTDIGWFKKMKHGYHYYLGNDKRLFRYPDEALLMTGNIFSDREFEIIRLIHSGLNSEQIGEKLFLSKYTVDTHRRNILEKTGKAHFSELIYDLHEMGLL